MIDDIKQPIEDVKESFKSRLESPYWGFIFFSWLGFNWQNIARLMMSEKPVEERITEITSQDWFFLHYWLAPVIVGVALAVSAPYFQLCIGLAHRIAMSKNRAARNKSMIEEKEDFYAAEIEAIALNERVEKVRLLSEKRIKEDSLQQEEERELKQARARARAAFQEYKKRRFEVGIEELEDYEHNLKKKIEDAKNQQEIVDSELNATLNIQNEITKRLNRIAGIYFDFEGAANREVFSDFIAALHRADVLKIDNVSDELKSMVERETLLKALK